VSLKTPDHINAKFEAKITDWSAQIDAKQGPAKEREPREPREPGSKPRRPRRNSGSGSSREQSKKKDRKDKKPASSSEASLEDQLRNVMDQVAKRSSSVRFSKDDFESLSEA